MKDNKGHDMQVDLSISCDNYDIANRKPCDAIHVGITVEDKVEGTVRRLNATVEPGGKVVGEWERIADRMLEPILGLSDLVDDDWFDVSGWSYVHGSQKSNQARIGVDWLSNDIWVGLRTYTSDRDGRGYLYVSGRGELISLVDDVMAIEPCAWFLPTYRPEDWLAHEGRFTLSSFDEKERDWTRQKILRGIEVASSELAHYNKMARVYAEKTGDAILDSAS